jgi:hypothetical protein
MLLDDVGTLRVSMFLLRYLPHCDFERDQVVTAQW